MTEHGEEVPAYRTIRVTAQDGPVAELSEEEAWRARERYPEILGTGGPVFCAAREREQGGWEVRCVGGSGPQTARDALAAEFRRRARRSARTAHAPAYLAAAARLERERPDDLTVLGERYRVVRCEEFVRMGPDGPEPPRPSDPDPAVYDDACHPGRTKGFVIDPAVGTGMSAGVLKLDLLQFVRAEGSAPPDVERDERRAAVSHPGGVLLPAAFMVAERTGGEWQAHTASCDTPQDARDALTMWLRVLAPVTLELAGAERDAYERAGDRLARRPGNDVRVEGRPGRCFKVVRVERLVRIGPDGPEGPRPSDQDPDTPSAERARQRDGAPDRGPGHG
ncbi:DUF5954 family protein [Streptomyces sp. NBC_01525]|uniref:PE-PGRS family protein n=1 Tax=Streptomyces benahoarensis TaxID=2595054 RepID=A0A553XVS6_9ACTN|nr:DUF5954 family protein [Streptomyces benahoarensis]TSB13285.1 PE-PGRS family protein [Streptomyces benahoarensis]TSB21090.1 PE-PGRS family protein [Streptomyces benahoarensis]